MPASQTAIRRRRTRTMTKRQETAFAVIIALVGFLITVLVLANFDSFRFAFAEWGENAPSAPAAPVGD
jgi:uncharacterized integral membrane protein